MRRTGNLFEQIVDRGNLLTACGKALRGKRDRLDARLFVSNLETELIALATGLRDGTFPLGRCRQFLIHDPKERLITAPHFAERVLHHAVMNICEPVFERWLINDTHACRVAHGRVKALLRARRFANGHAAFLKLDIRKYFDSISHEILLNQLRRLFKDQRLLALLERIIRSFRGAEGRGLPIGSLTSQHLANSHLGCFDRFVKETLRVRGYVRYMDDCALWGNSPRELGAQLAACEEFLKDQLQLHVKPFPYCNWTRHGMDFLGCRVFSTHVTLNRRSRIRYRRKIAAVTDAWRAGSLCELELQQRATAVVAFARAEPVRSWQTRRRVLEEIEVRGQEVARTA